ncbi:MAG TPA: cytochrome d ubiquinol oxidase subunit II [Noviherbaspirillum sp.]|uniref:cytochrome d ubiquinol oxidase subunit II n=1 Tax=Noviherbaspirillum sp. TaxID=1926288 RepID=UPI002B48344F|nr:cytochrome d ubiquinol oxidase subunit II [Noviherbaspirillum sp.]HJV86345.1 cytochrome d ubiquinol oxidase subunit II [Noviherbaspirillum sp.]
MSTLEYTLPVIWALLIGVAVAMYVVLDGFDLGLGILFPFFKTEAQRDQAMNTVAPFWDGNETWLVLGGGGLWVAFPKAYAVIMPAVYLPIIIMLLALIFRGVAFEFRWVAKPHHHHWDVAFAAGSTLAAFAQGVVLGALLQEIRVENGQFAGGAFDWLTPFSVMCGLALVAGYALLGATWLMMKAGGDVEHLARRMGTPLLLGMLGFIALVSVWTPLQIGRIADRWFSLPNFYWLAPLPLATLLLAWFCWRGIQNNRTLVPFASAAGLFLLAYIGLLISNAPYLVPPTITLWQAAAHPSSQVFLLIGAVILLPMILGYTVFVFWVFRGKVQPGEGYH